MTETGLDLADPAAYLAAALDRVEATAEAAGSEAWKLFSLDPDESVISLAKSGDDVAEVIGDHPSEYAAHIAANDPAHVLRLVAAHRKLLAMHVPGGDKGDDCLGCCEGMNRYEDLIYDWWPCPTIKLLAGAYGWTA
jgi:hypothetical protein